MLREYILCLYIFSILFIFTTNGDAEDVDFIKTPDGYLVPSLTIENDGNFLAEYKAFNNTTFKGEPSYIVEVHPISNRVNTNDFFSMSIFISGAGSVNFAKMRVHIPNYIVKEPYVTLEETYFNLSSPDSGKIRITPLLKSTNTEPAFDLHIVDAYFVPQDIKTFANYGEFSFNETNNPFYNLPYNPPYRIYFNISPNAPAGDHNIHVNLFYKSNGKWYSDTQTVPLHINDWYENKWIQWLIVAALLAAIWPIIKGIGVWIIDKLSFHG